MAAKACNFILDQYDFRHTWARTMGPLLETGVSLVHWMVWTYMHCSAWEARISYLLVQNCSWNSSGDRGAQGQAESKVSQVLAGLRMVYCFIGGFAPTYPMPTCCRSLRCYRIKFELHFTWSLREAHMAFHHLRICHTKETSELCLSLTLLPVARYCYCPSHYIVRVLIALYDDDDDDDDDDIFFHLRCICVS
jgi:hypothetical protein